jgi:hypothetical protein
MQPIIIAIVMIGLMNTQFIRRNHHSYSAWRAASIEVVHVGLLPLLEVLASCCVAVDFL